MPYYYKGRVSCRVLHAHRQQHKEPLGQHERRACASSKFDDSTTAIVPLLVPTPCQWSSLMTIRTTVFRHRVDSTACKLTKVFPSASGILKGLNYYFCRSSFGMLGPGEWGTLAQKESTDGNSLWSKANQILRQILRQIQYRAMVIRTGAGSQIYVHFVS